VKSYEAKASEAALEIKEAYWLYEDFIVSATNESNFGREARARAIDEALITKVYDQAATDMKTIANIEEGEHTKLKRKATAIGETAQEYEEAESEVLHVAKVTRDSMKHKENNSSSST
jgi:hypothetical protein